MSYLTEGVSYGSFQKIMIVRYYDTGIPGSISTHYIHRADVGV